MDSPKNNIVVYTTITNNCDKLREFCKDPKVAYICFTDNIDLKSDTWDIRYVQSLWHKDPKMQPDKWVGEYKYNIWIDSTIKPTSMPSTWIDYLQGNKIATFSARDYQCAYKEAEVCKEAGLDKPQNIDALIKIMRSLNYPEQNGLSACGVIVRENCFETIKFGVLWRDMVLSYSIRDQISYNYSLWACNVNQSFLPGNIYNNDLITRRKKQ